MKHDNATIERHLESIKDKARIADEFAAKGDYQQAVYRLTDALLDITAIANELAGRGEGPRT